MNNIQIDFVKRRIGELCFVGDGAHAKIRRQDSGILYLSAKNLKDGKLDLTNVDYISAFDYEKYFKPNSKQLKKDDVIFGIIGTIGEPCVVKSQDLFGISSSVSILRTDANIIFPKYLFYWIKGHILQNALYGIKGGVAQGYVSLEMIKSLPLWYPSLLTQRKIAAILSAYDDLIENNLQRIKILEEMAQNLYREWFVNFRFPDHEKVQIVDSPMGRIPEGWEITNIKEVIEEQNIRNRSEKDIPVLSVTRDHEFVLSEEYFSKRVYSKSLKNYKLLKQMDFAFNPARINIGSYAILHKYREALVSPMYSVFSVKPEKVSPLFLWTILNQEDTFKQIQALCFGTVRQTFKFQDFRLVRFTLPANEIRIEYENLIKPINQEKTILNLTITNLRQTRDLLLPKLISGELDVSDLDIKVGEAG